MADPVINEQTAVDEVERALQDIKGDWFGADTVAAYNNFLIDHIVTGDEETITMTKKGPLYLPPSDYKKQVLLASKDPVFTGEDNITYTWYARGIRAMKTVGSPTLASIDVTGIRCFFNLAVADLYDWLAAHKAQLISESVGGSNQNADQVADRCWKAASMWRGSFGI